MLESKNISVENRGHIRFILDGKVKTLSSPVTGAALHIIAGNPMSLSSGGAEVPNNGEPFNLVPDQEFISKFQLKRPEKLPPDGVEHKPVPAVAPVPSQDPLNNEPHKV